MEVFIFFGLRKERVTFSYYAIKMCSQFSVSVKLQEVFPLFYQNSENIMCIFGGCRYAIII